MENVIEISYADEICLKIFKKNRRNEYEMLAKFNNKYRIASILSELRLSEILHINASPKHNQVSLTTDEVQIILKDYNKLKKDRTLNNRPSIKTIIGFINRELLKRKIMPKGKLKLIAQNIITPKTTIAAALLLSISIGTVHYIENHKQVTFVEDKPSITESIDNPSYPAGLLYISPKIAGGGGTLVSPTPTNESNIKILEPTEISVVQKDKYIDKIASIFGTDYEKAEDIIKNMETQEPQQATKDNAWTVTTLDLLDTINDGKSLNYNRQELQMVQALLKEYLNDNSIDKTPMSSHKTEEEKEKYIIDIARTIYGVVDEELLETMIMARRLETGHGTSNRCMNDNNQGGVRANGKFAIYKTFEIGAESFVRNFLVIYARSLIMGTYQSTNNVAEIMGQQYCTEETKHWISTVNELCTTETISVLKERIY